jgi:hypothetical protein
LAPVIAVLVLVVASTTRAAPVSGVCGHATAEQVAGKLDPFTVGVPDPVGPVLCGQFTGRGSDAMAVGLLAPTCWGIQQWAVFTFADGAWKRVLDRSEFIYRLAAVGDEIRVTMPVFAIGDPRCVPTGGKSTRLWHWNGVRLVAGPPTITRPKIVHRYEFQTPDHNTACNLADDDTAYCASTNRPHVAAVDSAGHVHICRGRRCLGPSHRAYTKGLPVLEYGQSDVTSLYVCRSEKAALTCIRKSDRRGFRSSPSSVTQIG